MITRQYGNTLHHSTRPGDHFDKMRMQALRNRDEAKRKAFAARVRAIAARIAAQQLPEPDEHAASWTFVRIDEDGLATYSA